MKSYPFLLLICIMPLACFKGSFLKRKSSDNPSHTNAATEAVGSGEIKSDSSISQTVKANPQGAIGSASASFPPGTFAVDTTISIEQGDEVATDLVLSELTDDPEVQIVSSAAPVFVAPSEIGIDVNQEIQYEIPAPEQASLLGESYLVVIYKVYSSEGKYKVGMLLNPTVDGSLVRFSFKGLGIFQAALLSKEVAATEKETPTPVVSATVASSFGPVEWNNDISIAQDGSLSIQISVTGLSTLNRCLILVDRDQLLPFDARVIVEDFSTNTAIARLVDQAHEVYLRFRCVGVNGRDSGLSAWTDPQSIPQKIETQQSSGTVNVVNPQLNVSFTQPSAPVFGQSISIPMTVTNTGDGPAKNVTFSSLTAPFSQGAGSTCGVEILPSTSCIYYISFNAGSTSTETANFTVSFTDNATPTSVSATVTITPAPAIIAVTPAYPVNGADWNDYVAISDQANDLAHQTDSACLGTETYATGCINGGEYRKATTNLLTSCVDITVSDSLGALQWSCLEEGGGLAFYSGGLHPSKGLATLLDSAAWKPIKIQIKKNASLVIESDSSLVWWANTVVAAPDSSAAVQTLSTAGAIYVVSADTSSAGLNINADGISIVVLPSYTLSSTGDAASCSTTGETAGPTWKCLVAAGNQKFVWIEGAFDGSSFTSSGYGLLFYGTKMSVVRNASFVNHFTTGVRFSTSSNSNRMINTRVDRVRDYSATGTGIYIDPTRGGLFSNVVISNAYTGLKITSNVGTKSEDYTFTQLMISSAYKAISLDGNKSTFSHVTLANNSYAGIDVQGVATGDNVFANMVVLNSGTYGIITQKPLEAVNLVASSSSIEISLQSGASAFHGYLVTDATGTKCSITSGTGLITSTCTDTGADGSSTYTSLPSTAVFHNGFNPAAAIFGKVTADEPVNLSDTNGAALFASITDWRSFSSFPRAWGIDGSSFPNSDHRGGCIAGTCRVWDFSAVAGGALNNKSGDGVTDNGAFTANSTCPSAANGNLRYTDNQTGANTFLLNALEIFGDGNGDEDGLCETGETCLYSANIGFDQGTNGISSNTCLYDDGDATITGVEIKARG